MENGKAREETWNAETGPGNILDGQGSVDLLDASHLAISEFYLFQFIIRRK